MYQSVSRAVTWWDALVYGTILVLTYVMYWLFIQPLLGPLRKLPGPPFKPIVGNMWETIKSETMEITIKWCEKYGPIYRYYFLFGDNRVAVVSPEGFKQVFVTDVKKYKKPGFGLLKHFEQLMGKGLLMLEGKVHAERRKMLNPIFKHTAIKDMTKIFIRYGHDFVQLWSEKLENKDMVDVEVQEDLSRLTLDVIGECTLGYRFNSLKSEDENSAVSKAFAKIIGGSELTLKFLIPFFNRRLLQQLQKDIAICDDVVKTMVEERIKKHKQEGVCTNDMLDLLINAHDENDGGLTERELHDEIMTFMFAGHETTSTGMSWFLLAMADHPEIQDKIRSELNAVLPSDGTPVTLQHLDELKYLPCAIKESLRLFPPVPLTIRQAAVDTDICGHFIPKGTKLTLNPGAMMRLPQYWKDPLTFNPDRFLDDQEIQPYTWLPFAIGPRMCIGYKFALNEMRTMLALILKSFKFSRTPGTAYGKQLRVTMRPSPSLKLRIERVTE